MAGQPASALCDRGQECSLCSDVASVCRTVDRHPATRMLGSDPVLVRARHGTETVRIPGLLQCSSGACVVGRRDASPETEGCRNAQPLPMGRALPRTLSDADRRLKSESEDAGWWVASPVFDVPRVTAIAKPTRCFSSTSYARHPDRVEDDSGSRDKNSGRSLKFLRIRQPQLRAPSCRRPCRRSCQGSCAFVVPTPPRTRRPLRDWTTAPTRPLPASPISRRPLIGGRSRDRPVLLLSPWQPEQSA